MIPLLLQAYIMNIGLNDHTGKHTRTDVLLIYLNHQIHCLGKTPDTYQILSQDMIAMSPTTQILKCCFSTFTLHSSRALGCTELGRVGTDSKRAHE
jgi:hypothetical protein